jgi:hypothetical protein
VINLSLHLKSLCQTILLIYQGKGRWLYYRLAKGSDYLQQLNAMVRSLPDPNEIYSVDSKRFNDPVLLSKDGRCRVGILSDDLSAEAT